LLYILTHKNLITTVDINTFTLLKEQAIEVFASSITVRNYASGKGLQSDVERINATITENKRILALANSQLSELKQSDTPDRIGFFDTIKTL
jgi:hypothetical protein